MTDELPAEVAFVSATPTQGTCTGSTTVICNIGTLANGASAMVTIVVTPLSGGVITNTAGVGSNVTDPNTTNNSQQRLRLWPHPRSRFVMRVSQNRWPVKPI